MEKQRSKSQSKTVLSVIHHLKKYITKDKKSQAFETYTSALGVAAEYIHPCLPFLTVSPCGVSDQGGMGSGTSLFSQTSNPPYTSTASAMSEQRNQ